MKDFNEYLAVYRRIRHPNVAQVFSSCPEHRFILFRGKKDSRPLTGSWNAAVSLREHFGLAAKAMMDVDEMFIENNTYINWEVFQLDWVVLQENKFVLVHWVEGRGDLVHQRQLLLDVATSIPVARAHVLELEHALALKVHHNHPNVQFPRVNTRKLELDVCDESLQFELALAVVLERALESTN